jgi:hypothetical protein
MTAPPRKAMEAATKKEGVELAGGQVIEKGDEKGGGCCEQDDRVSRKKLERGDVGNIHEAELNGAESRPA